MKQLYLLLFLLCTQFAFAIEGNDDNVLRDYYVQRYSTQKYIPDFERIFASEIDRQDYKKLREYLNQKKEIARVLHMAGDEYYYGLSFSRLFAEDYIQSLENDLAFRDTSDKILLRLNSIMPNIHYNGEYTAGEVQSEILPIIKERYRQAFERDSLNQIVYTQIQENIETVQQDIFLCEQALNISLSPEYQQQKFRIWISLTFSGLIAVLLCVFFFIIYRRSDRSLAKHLLSDTGLQFITIFVLIIAIILFGILNILGGSELAAILSGISGYILGKGGSMLVGKRQEENPPVPEAAKMELPLPVEEPTQPEIIQEEEEKPEEEKYFPGENL